VQIEAVELGLTRIAGGDVTEVAGAAAGGDAAQDGGSSEPGACPSARRTQRVTYCHPAGWAARP